MKIKWLIFFIGIQCLSLISTAQKPASNFYFRVGGNLFVSWQKDGESFFLPTINATPGLRLVQSKDFALTVTAPVSVGPFFKSGSNITYGADFPAMVELSLASATGNAEKAELGLLIGAGFSYHLLGRYRDSNEPSGTVNTWKSADFWGLRFNAGISFGKSKSGDRGILIGGFGESVTSDKRYIVSLGLAYIIGNLQKFKERQRSNSAQ
jgi:hypothetical protein